MKDRSPCLAIIPAKWNSRRLPHKNFLRCGGKTLVQHAINTALFANVFARVVVSASSYYHNDSYQHSESSIMWIVRPLILCEDGITTAMVCLDVLAHFQYWYPSFCLLVPTSPLRTPETVRMMWDLFCNSGAPEIMSIGPGGHEGTGIFCDTLEFLKRRDFYHLNAGYFRVPENEICDVNTADDLAKAEEKLAARRT